MATRVSKQLNLSDISKEDQCPPTIGFRLKDEDKKVLLARAKVMKVSVHDLARFYTEIALGDREERVSLRDAIQKVEQQVAELRRDIMLSTAVLLNSAGKIDENEAREWVEENIGKI